MKTFRFLEVIFLMGILCLSFSACGKDEGDDPANQQENSNNNLTNGGESSENNLSEEEKAFLGGWDCLGYNCPDFFFLEEDVCCAVSNNSSKRKEVGNWKYNPETSILATTVFGSWQFEITLKTEQTWAGINFSENRSSQSFSRYTNLQYVKGLFKYLMWADENDNLLLFDEYSIGGGTFLGSYEDLSIAEDDNLEDFTFKYALDYSQYKSGKLTIENPYNLTNCKLIFEGPLQGVLKVKEWR